MKPKYWHRYVDDVFAVWPHRQAVLKDFLGHLNSRHPDITFSWNWKGMANYPFWMSWSTDAWTTDWGMPSIGKPPIQTHLQAASHHPPAHKRSVITTLMDRVNTICDEASQASELQHVRSVLQANGYSLQDINRTSFNVFAFLHILETLSVLCHKQKNPVCFILLQTYII
jgi:hypothetical protein